MTLKELWLLVVRHLKLVITLPVVFALVCVAWTLLAPEGSASYTVSARIIANTYAAGVHSIAGSEARAAIGDDADYKYSTGVEGGTNTVVISITGPEKEACIALADSIADKAAAKAEKLYEGMESPYNGYVEHATGSKDVEKPNKSKLKYLIGAIVGGLFVAICVVVIIDLRRRAVKTPEGAQAATELPVLELLPAKSGERLLANVRFASGNDGLSSVLIVPTGDVFAADQACTLLNDAAIAEGVETFKAEVSAPLAESMSAAYAARDVDAVLVAVSQWKDSLPQLESAVAELKLADAAPVGIVFASGKGGNRKR